MSKSKKSPCTPNQVRIIGGKFKRRTVQFIDADGLRPTPDRLRETLFNWLMADILQATVLDVCAGSGVLAFEALSRGAKHATLIEANNAQAKLLHQTAQTLQLNTTEYTIINGTAEHALTQLDTPFDIIFLDPPYAYNLWQSLLTRLLEHSLCHRHTLIYIESDKPLATLIDSLAFDVLKTTKIGQVYAGLICPQNPTQVSTQSNHS